MELKRVYGRAQFASEASDSPALAFPPHRLVVDADGGLSTWPSLLTQCTELGKPVQDIAPLDIFTDV